MRDVYSMAVPEDDTLTYSLSLLESRLRESTSQPIEPKLQASVCSSWLVLTLLQALFIATASHWLSLSHSVGLRLHLHTVAERCFDEGWPQGSRHVEARNHSCCLRCI